MGNCACATYCQSSNHQNVISVDIPNRNLIMPNNNLLTHTNSNYESSRTKSIHFKMLSNSANQSETVNQFTNLNDISILSSKGINNAESLSTTKKRTSISSFQVKTQCKTNQNQSAKQTHVNKSIPFESSSSIENISSNINFTTVKPQEQECKDKLDADIDITKNVNINHNNYDNHTNNSNNTNNSSNNNFDNNTNHSNNTNNSSNNNCDKSNNSNNDNNTSNSNNNSVISLTKEEEEIFNNKDIIKIVILGGKGVGKSSFLIKILQNKFEKLYIPTIGIEKRSKTLIQDGKKYNLYFIVTPGDSAYRSNYSIYFEKANFIYVFYDMSNPSSFNEAKELLIKEVSNYKEIIKKGKTHITFIGNKKDIVNTKVSLNEIKMFCNENNFSLVEISVKSGIGMKALIQDLCRNIKS